MNTTLDRTFFALSDPTRRGILERLGRGPATIDELAQPFGLTLDGMKKHVGIFDEVDLVVTAKFGRVSRRRSPSMPRPQRIRRHRPPPEVPEILGPTAGVLVARHLGSNDVVVTSDPTSQSRGRPAIRRPVQ
jgi:DNA-binding transcriptional ArsR family regulator